MDNKPLQNAGIHAVVLAAGKGTRMKSDLPKVLHNLGETPLVIHVLTAAISAGIHNISIVVGHGKEQVQEEVSQWARALQNEVQFSFPVQEPQNGTGHAVLVAEDSVPNDTSFVMVLLGDVPLLQSETIVLAYENLANSSAKGLVITTELEDPTGYGRVKRDEDGYATSIIEEKDATDEEKKITEINTGIFLFRNKEFFERLKQIGTDNAQGEIYLTDMVKMVVEAGEKFAALKIQEPIQFMGINSKEDLAKLSESYVPVLRRAK